MVSNPQAIVCLAARLAAKRGANTVEGAFDVADDERGFEPHDAIAGALERRVTARVSTPTLGVVRAIDLNHEALRGSHEIRDEATE